ncbi:MAG: aminopeptidase, partial [Clostridia bacterium]|nr:aminopeptidase [Clostridia bacterium]
MSEKTEVELLKEKLFKSNKNGRLEASEETLNKADEYCEGYKAFLDAAKTEREAVSVSVSMAEKAGFKEFKLGEKYNAGDKVYINNRGKAAAFAVIGKEPVENGVNITAAHIDSPRLDLKPNPLYEELELALFKT